MKIRAERKAFADALAWVAQAVARKAQAPALAGIKIVATSEGLTLQAFDYDIGHTAALDVDVLEPGQVLVSGRYLSMVVSGLRGADVELVLEGSALVVSSGRATYRIQTMVLDDYPTLPQSAPRVGVVDADPLERLLVTVAAPIDDQSKFEQTQGLHLESGEHDGKDGLWAVGSDTSARSVHIAVGPWSQDAALDATVPSVALVAAVKGMSGTIEIGRSEGLLSLSDESRTVTMRTYAIPYLRGQWRQLMAKNAARDEVPVIIKAAELAGAVKRAASFGEDGRESLVAMVVRSDSITVTAGTDGLDGEDVIEAEMAGDPAWFGVNALLLTQALTAAAADEVIVGLAGSGEIKGAHVLDIRPVGRDDARFLVMPRAWTGEAPE